MDQNYTNNYFATPINEGYPLKDPLYNRQPASDNGSELYDFLFGGEDFQLKNKNIEQRQQRQQNQRQENDTYSDTLIIKKRNKPEYSLKQTTGRLDFRSNNSYVSDSQLKSMSSKERRQLRNKISARNFRNRRKEYISTLEEEMSQQKAENRRLKAELQIALDTIAKLRKENDKLRLNVILGESVLPSENQIVMEHMSNSIFPANATNIIDNTTTISVNNSNKYPSSNSSSNGSILSSPPDLSIEPLNDWNFVLPTFSNTTAPVNNPQNTYLSHVLLPMWNFNQIICKEQQTSTAISPNGSSQLFYQYPLLAPALMSVVLSHTMMMSTEELLSNATLFPTTNQPDYIKYNDKNPFELSSNITDKEAKAIWDILEPLTLLKERNERFANTNKESAVATQPQSTECDNDFYLPWFQRYMYKYLFDYITTGTAANPTRQRKFILCVKFHQARRYINV